MTKKSLKPFLSLICNAGTLCAASEGWFQTSLNDGNGIKAMIITLERCRQPIAVSDISVYICLIDTRDSSSKPVYGGVDRLMIGTYSYGYLWYTM